jgi:hypothetical protein
MDVATAQVIQPANRNDHPTVRPTVRLPDQITIEHGPRDLLARFFLIADHAARERGVRLYLRSDLEEFVAFSEAARGGKYRLGTFHPAYSRLSADNAYWIEGRDAAGTIVATQAGRFFDWPDAHLEQELCALRMFYADPAANALPGEHCFIRSPSAQRIRGRVLYSGGTWFSKDFRGRGLSAILPRISRAYAYTRWRNDFTISFVEDALVRKSVVASYGYTNIEPGIGFRGTLMADMDLNLVWMDAAELVDDLAEFVSLNQRRGFDEARRGDHAISA